MQELVIYAYLTGSFQMIQISSFLLCGCLLSLAFFFFLSLRGYDNTSHIVFINITCSLDMACRFCQTEHMEETFLVNSALVFSYADFRDRKNAFLLRFNFHRGETKPLNVREIVLTRLDTAPLNHIFWLKASFCKKKKKKNPSLAFSYHQDRRSWKHSRDGWFQDLWTSRKFLLEENSSWKM